MYNFEKLKRELVCELEKAGEASPYSADANEPDPRYKAYGVRAPELKLIFRKFRTAIRTFDQESQIELAADFIKSGLAEQQTLGFFILEPHAAYFDPNRFDVIDRLMRYLYGWSKVDGFTTFVLQPVLLNHPEEFLPIIQQWNQDEDMWLRRASVVVFTRKVAKFGRFNDFALKMCENLKYAPEDLVRKGVGWALKDLMRSDQARILEYVLGLHKQNVSKVITSYAIRDLKGPERADFLMKV